MNALPLRDIHLPGAVSWWPPAPGWWMLLALIAGAAAAVWYWRRSGLARKRLYRQALAELERIENLFGREDERQALENLSVLLRRIAISRYPREHVASLTGERWLQFLDSVTGAAEFSRGPGRALADAPYNPALRTDNIPDLIDLCRRWLKSEFTRTDTKRIAREAAKNTKKEK